MGSDIERLLTIMRSLRDPEDGCPWDLQQDFASIAPYTIEEAYEVADAIQRGDIPTLQDELGDLLLQVVFHSQMAHEQQAFDFNGVVQSICDKMIRRHPHVFGNTGEKRLPADADSVRQSWESIKQQERAGQGAHGVLDDIPRGMAELQRACKLQKRAASVGFDWDSAEQVMAKLHEETAELQQAITDGQQAEVQEELGDLLFTVVNLARKLEVDPARALRSANAKFETRFRAVEQIAGGGAGMREMEIDDLEQIWQSIKESEDQHS
ncbi:MAG TPA: nucleoside triphosphate pyrophosphohydrolase [Xanthomonadales bacterium]|nr:nucleoside triphosphate pyrophosphohydrolase [Xanthomonadales bacterium]